MTAFTTLNLLESSPRDTVARNAIEEIRSTLASAAESGLMSAEDKTKLDGIEAGATKTEISASGSTLIINPPATEEGDNND